MRVFNELGDREQIDLLAYEIQRQKKLQALLDQMGKKRPLDTKKEITETNSLTPEVLALLMMAML